MLCSVKVFSSKLGNLHLSLPSAPSAASSPPLHTNSVTPPSLSPLPDSDSLQPLPRRTSSASSATAGWRIHVDDVVNARGGGGGGGGGGASGDGMGVNHDTILRALEQFEKKEKKMPEQLPSREAPDEGEGAGEVGYASIAEAQI
jgi:hypothetical protein